MAVADWAVGLRETFAPADTRSYGEMEFDRIAFDLRSENARKAIKARRRCKLASCGALVGRGELYCRRHLAHDQLR